MTERLRAIDASSMTDDALIEYDQMMLDRMFAEERVTTLAVAVWQDVLTELNRRGKVQLLGEVTEDVRNSLAERS